MAPLCRANDLLSLNGRGCDCCLRRSSPASDSRRRSAPSPACSEKSMRGGQKISTSWLACPHRARRVDRRRRNDGDRRRGAVFVIVVAPLCHVGYPRPANIVDERAFERERALFEIVVMVRRQLGNVARAVSRFEVVHHESGAAKDAAEAAFLGSHVEAVGVD